ncbi:glycosyltransferase [Bacillus licheniformis]|nr:glycosyltransferase [Bacillus licheniformis]
MYVGSNTVFRRTALEEIVRRTAIQKLAEELGVHYVTRQNNEHAKAGNLNHAMSCSNGELIVTMDADMVPLPSFLQKTVGYFKKALVFYTLVWKEKKREPEKLGDQDHRPSVDILIATYNEERHVLKKSVAGCLNLDYPKELVNIYLCDDEIALILIGFWGSRVNSRFKKFLIILCLMTNGVYIVWRFGFTLPVSRPADIVMGVILIATECIGFLQHSRIISVFNR